MASTINADDGVISGSAGVKTTPDASGILDLQTNGTTAVTIQSDRRVQINGSNSLATTLVATSNTFPLNNAASAYQFRANCTFGTANTNAVGFGSTYQLPATGAFSSSYQFYVDTLDTGGATLTNNYGVFVATQTVGTNIYGVFSNIASGTNRYNFYANGTAPNYFEGAVQVNGNLQFNSGFGSVSTAYGCRAWVNFNGTANSNLSGTYSRTSPSTTLTVTATAHGLTTGNSVYLDFTTGTAVDGVYTVTVTGANTFTVTTAASTTTSGNVTLVQSTIRASGNVSSVADNGVGDYTINFSTAMPDGNYALCGVNNGSGGTSNAILTKATSINAAPTNQTTAAVNIVSANSSTGLADSANLLVAVFR